MKNNFCYSNGRIRSFKKCNHYKYFSTHEMFVLSYKQEIINKNFFRVFK